MKKSKSKNPAAENESSQKSEPNDFLIVGIGASAGGVQALKTFFENVAADSNAAYVVILHLSPDHDSQLAEVLQTVALIPVTQVKEKVKVEPNRVYVVPPNESLSMADGHIVVSPIHTVEERRAPVDIFFRTLAESHCSRAVAVVLSGTGANGSMGIKRVKENGGAAFVQNPREAEFGEMPRNSIATQLVDEILNVAEIPQKIVAYQKNLGKVIIPVETENREEEQQEEEQQTALREIFTLLRVRTGHDFSNYKRPTVLRRIERRINVRNLPDLPKYVDFLKENQDETNALLKDLLISVTNFFRDKEAFQFLEQEAIPKILGGKKSDNEIRLWVAGCATGEEAYSIAMLLVEKIDGSLDAPSVQIFATDIDDAAIGAARNGFYTLNDAADVSPERLRRFFTKEKDGYRIRRELREMVLFAKHNLLKDPPFSRLDLVTCRNLLIYFNNSAQERAMETFHFALRPGGFMFLGSSESIDGAGDLFAPLSREQRVFQARQTAPRFSHPVPDLSASFSFNSSPSLVTALQENKNLSPERVSYGDLHQEILEQYAPPSLIVNERFDIVHVSERAGRFLQIAGEPSHNLFKLIRPDLRLALSTAVYQAVERQKSVIAENLKFQIGDRPESVNVQVRPVLRLKDETARGFLLVIFEQTGEASAIETEIETEAVFTSGETATRGLEEALMRSQSEHRHSIEHSEVQAEELKASNEELQAINEELRSATEELETGKEELQSVNEELITVNQELKIKIEELSTSNSDLQNLMNSTDIGTIFLDRALRVKMFTPVAREIFNLIAADMGRVLSDITHKLEYQDLIADIETVLSNLQPIEREVRTSDGNVYLMQVTPYRTAEDRINGTIVTFINITARKHSEDALRESEEQIAADLAGMRRLYELQSKLANQTDVKLALEDVLAVACEFTDTDRGCVQLLSDDRERLEMAVWRGYADDSPFIDFFRYEGFESGCEVTRVERKRLIIEDTIGFAGLEGTDAGVATYADAIRAAQSTPMTSHSGETIGVISTQFREPHRPGEHELRLMDMLAWTAAEFLERHRADQALRESEERLRQLIKNLPGGAAFIVDRNLRYLLADGASLAATGFAPEDFVGKSIFDALPPESAAEYEAFYRAALAGESFTHEHEAQGGTYITRGAPLRSTDGQIYGVLAISYDISDRKRAEENLRESEERFRAMFEQANIGIVQLDFDGRFLAVNPGFSQVIGYTEKELRTMAVGDITPPDDLKIEEAENRRLLAGKISGYSLEKRAVHKSGAIVWAKMTATLVRGESGEPLYMLSIVEDITTRKQAESALGESEERFRTLVESVTDYAIFAVDEDNRIVSWNTGAEKVFGFEEREIIGKSGAILFTMEDREQGVPEREMQIASETGRAEDERWHIRRDGSRFYASGVMTTFKSGAGFVKIARDMTDKIKIQKALHDKEMLQKLVSAQEDERKRIARDLHDELGQLLTGLRLKLEAVRKLCETNEELSGKVDETQTLAKQIDAGIDFLAWELRPAALDHLGLQPALEKYVREWSHYADITAELLGSNVRKTRLAPEAETNLYRIAQEALNNVHKHAAAKCVEISLEKRGADTIVLIISDDGRGFNPKNKMNRSTGIGLIGMKERAALVGGTLEIESAPGKGTTVHVRVPITVAPKGDSQ